MRTRELFRAVRKNLNEQSTRSAWNKGVNAYAFELLAELEESVNGGYTDRTDLRSRELVKKHLLNGASDWGQYSWGGCALIYDGDIAERLCNPSELKKTRNGEKKPNWREEWLDVQARALYQASARIEMAFGEIYTNEAREKAVVKWRKAHNH